MKVANNLDLTGHELQNAVRQNLAAAPSSPKVGQNYFDTTLGYPREWNGSEWKRLDDGGGATDHGGLAGLADDDHLQYHTDGRADTWLAAKTTDNLTEGTTNKYVTQAQKDKINNIAVTQPVDLDQMENDIAALANGMVYKGDWDASVGTFPGAGSAEIGWFYNVSVGGTVDGVVFDVGDSVIAVVDNASTTTYAANWNKKDATDAVQSVNGEVGTVVLNTGNVAEVTDKRYITDAQQTVLSGLSGKFSATITGNGSLTSFPVTHSFNTRDVKVEVFDNSTFETIIVDVTRNTVNQVTIDFGTAPVNLKEYRVVVMG